MIFQRVTSLRSVGTLVLVTCFRNSRFLKKIGLSFELYAMFAATILTVCSRHGPIAGHRHHCEHNSGIYISFLTFWLSQISLNMLNFGSLVVKICHSSMVYKYYKVKKNCTVNPQGIYKV